MDFNKINLKLQNIKISNEITIFVYILNNNTNIKNIINNIVNKKSYWSMKLKENTIREYKNQYLYILKKTIVFNKSNINKLNKELSILEKKNINIERIKLCLLLNNDDNINYLHTGCYIENNFIVENKFKENDLSELYNAIINTERKLYNKIGLSYQIDDNNNRINNYLCFITLQYFNHNIEYMDYINNFIIKYIQNTTNLTSKHINKYIIFYDSNKNLDKGWCDYNDIENELINDENDEYDDNPDLIFIKKYFNKLVKKASCGNDGDINDSISQGTDVE